MPNSVETKLIPPARGLLDELLVTDPYEPSSKTVLSDSIVSSLQDGNLPVGNEIDASPQQYLVPAWVFERGNSPFQQLHSYHNPEGEREKLIEAAMKHDGAFGPVTLRETLDSLDFSHNFDAVNRTASRFGEMTLLFSMLNPPRDISTIKAKQIAAREIEDNPTLRGQIEKIVMGWKAIEDDYFRLLEFHDSQELLRFRGQISAFIEACDIQAASSPYLGKLVDRVNRLAETELASFCEGVLWITKDGIKSSPEVDYLSPRFPVINDVTPATGIPSTVLSVFAGLYGGMNTNDLTVATVTFFASLGISWGASSAFLTHARTAANKRLSQALYEDPEVQAGIYAVAQLDELLSFAKIRVESKYPSTYPRIVNDSDVYFRAKEFRNLARGLSDLRCVATDLEINPGITYLTGPNSGGKSVITLGYVFSQMYAQAGGPILARDAECSLAENIVYVSPHSTKQNDQVGKFETECSRVSRTISQIAHAISLGRIKGNLVVLDDALEGTDPEEGAAILENVHETLRTLPVTALLCNHRRDIAHRMENKPHVHFLQVETDHGTPTYQVKTGISTSSGAAHAAERQGIGLNHLKEIREKYGTRE
jgi:DNA mismatch repair protein MutS